MFNIKKIRRITKKAKINNIEKLIEERAKRGENFMGILLNSPIDGVIDKHVIAYLKSKYGEDFVCQIATFGQYRLKNTIKAIFLLFCKYSSIKVPTFACSCLDILL